MPLEVLTRLPVVRERDALSQPAWFVAVPLNSARRELLRLYNFDEALPALFEIRMYAFDKFFGSTVLTLAPAQGIVPGYAELKDFRSVLQNASPYLQQISIEVRPLAPNARFWAFISSTDNVTQNILTILPD